MTRARDIASGSGIEAGEVTPHIIPDVLYPAVAGKLLDGSTSHSGAYGTAQSDSRNYYYTDIKGSKPIKDPRIGAYFGSQRHRATSIQLLEQETATHGLNVYSIDGREWFRAVGDNVITTNNANGHTVNLNSNDNWYEITFYGNDLNMAMGHHSANRGFVISVDGATESAEKTPAETSMSGDDNPKFDRYIDSAVLINVGVGATLGIHTVKIRPHSSGTNEISCSQLELIAHGLFTDATCDYNNDPTITHDANTKMVAGMSVTGTGIPTGATIASVTSTTAFELSASTTGGAVTNGTLTFGVADLIIPAQNVVSFGKKFSIPATAQHYDPFNGFTNLTTLHSANVDTATSLGLDTSTTYGASWTKDADEHIRPFNGGRVVKWVDSSGTIKTSVTMMPRNAQNIGNSQTNGSTGTVSDEISQATLNGASTTNAHTINFSDDVLDSSLAEVAKKFHWREFGNGAANEGTGSTYKADASMNNGQDDCGFVMDDGLTSLASPTLSNQVTGNFNGGHPNGSHATNESGKLWFTFIGTGLTLTRKCGASGNDDHRDYIDGVEITSGDKDAFGAGATIEVHHIAQNLPYGTHIYCAKQHNVGAYNIDIQDYAIHQPKMPPIPEDACIIADYMLMADFVVRPAGIGNISKGVRSQAASRDMLCDATGVSYRTMGTDASNSTHGIAVATEVMTSTQSSTVTLPYFGTDFVLTHYANRIGTVTEGLNSDVGTSASISTSTNAGAMKHTGNNLTVNQFKSVMSDGQGDDELWISTLEIATPIHTSSHYQTFETPFLHELVGGDRNMEQTNLVVTPDGKTWDEVTRDTSYINSNYSLKIHSDGGAFAYNVTVKWDMCRGLSNVAGEAFFNAVQKDFAIAYDRVICLRDGQYVIHFGSQLNSGQTATFQYILKNTTSPSTTNVLYAGWHSTSTWVPTNGSISVDLIRNDYIAVTGGQYNNNDNTNALFEIHRIGN